MNNPAVIEVMLLRWSDNQNGRTVTFLLPDDGEHPFRGLKCGPANGDRLAVSVARIADDETQHPVAAPPAAKPKSYAQLAGKWCADAEFQEFLFQNYMLGAGTKEAEAIKFVRDHCGVQSRSEIVEGSAAATKLDDLIARYMIWRHNANR